MNSPAEDPVAEIEWMAEMGLGFVDLTLEPPGAPSWAVDAKRVRAAIEKHGLQVVGHTAYYLPIANPFEEIRRAAVNELLRCLEVFAEVGSPWMNLHPDRHTPMHSRAYCIGRNLISLGELLPAAQRLGVGLMIENLPGDFNSPEQLGALLDPLPEVGLHLDIGHANLLVPHNMTEAILAQYGGRLRHVHLHDNKGGGADLHLPLGSGTVDYRVAVRALQTCGYDGTITLEVFTPDRQYLRYSRDVLQRAWDEASLTAARAASAPAANMQTMR
jgi:sugar phosphate isomerase/epimerase